MKVNMRIPIGIAIALVASVVPMSMAMPPPQCGDGIDNDGDGFTDHPDDPGCQSFWDNNEQELPCKLKHPVPHSHTYGTGGSVSGQSDTVFGPGSDEFGAGFVTVFDTNQYDCDWDNVPGDFDGDYDAGLGGGFFGHGPWRWGPPCNYDLADHGAAVTVNDVVFGNNIAFVTAADDTAGPVVTTDPVTGATTCSTDGSITPCDPVTGCGATGDPDDCISPVYVGFGTACGAGGDGGYWVFLSGFHVDEGPGVSVSNPATAGTITA